jgi:hypothetical protein
LGEMFFSVTGRRELRGDGTHVVVGSWFSLKLGRCGAEIAIKPMSAL